MDTLNPKPATPEDLNRAVAGDDADAPVLDYDELLADSLVPITPDAPLSQFLPDRVEGEAMDFRQWVRSTQDHMIAERTRRGYITELTRLAGKVLDLQGKAFATFNDRTDPEWLRRAALVVGVVNMVQHVRYGGYSPATMQMLYRALMWLLLQTELVPPDGRQALAMRMLIAQIDDLKHAAKQAKHGGAPARTPRASASLFDVGEGGGHGHGEAEDPWLEEARQRAAKRTRSVREPKRTISEADFEPLMTTLATSRNQAGTLWKERTRIFLLATLATAARPVEWQQASWKDRSRGVLRLPNYKRQRVPDDRWWKRQMPGDLQQAAQRDLVAMGLDTVLTQTYDDALAGVVAINTSGDSSAHRSEAGHDPGCDDGGLFATPLAATDVLASLHEMLASNTRTAPHTPALAVLRTDGSARTQLWWQILKLRAWQIRVHEMNWREVVVAPEGMDDVQTHLKNVRLHLSSGLAYDAYFNGCRHSLMDACRVTFKGGEKRFYSLYDARATAIANMVANVNEMPATVLEGAHGGAGAGAGTKGARRKSKNQVLSPWASALVSAAVGHFGQGERTVRRYYPSQQNAWSPSGRSRHAPMLALDSASQSRMANSLTQGEAESQDRPADGSNADAPESPGSGSVSAPEARA